MKINKSFLACCLFMSVASIATLSQENKQTFVDWLVEDNVMQDIIRPRHAMPAMVQAFPGKIIDTTIDVLSYDLYQDWFPALLTPRDERPLRKVEARLQTVVLSKVNSLATIFFDAVTLDVDSIKSGNTDVQFTKNIRGIMMTLPTPLQRGQQVDLTIYYATLRDDLGIVLIDKAKALSLDVAGSFGYTISQPENARRWFPCKDQPDDKAIFTAHVRVPNGYIVASNGVLTDSIRDGDTATIQTWHHSIAMSTYLFVLNAGQFLVYPQVFIRADSSKVPILNYHFAADQNGVRYSAERALTNLPLMFKALETRLGKYPLDSYGHVAVAGFPYGGMEHQTLSTVNREWLSGTAEAGYVHELAHQWLGDIVTCATWADIWLNEGGASFTEALYYEYVQGRDGYMGLLWRKRENYMRNGLNEPPVYNIPLGRIFNQATTYDKSAWVFHMMRKLVGDVLYFPTLRSYIAKYSQSSVQTFQLMEHFKSEIPNARVSWDVFFSQWLEKAGHPVFDVVARKVEGAAKTTYQITVSQTQTKDGVPEVFETPLMFRIHGVSNAMDTTVLINQRFQTFVVETGYDLVNLYVDQDHDVLCEMNSTIITDVADEGSALPWFHTLGPMPVSAGDPLRVYTENGTLSEVSVHDVSGRLVMSISIGEGVSLIPTTNLHAGAYMITLQSGTRIGSSTFFVATR